MFKQGDLKERTILACGKDLWLRAGDFKELKRSFIQLLIQREKEKAANEGREPDVIEFELMTEKEKEPASCHLSIETIELLSEYLRTYPESPQSDKLFPMSQDALNDLLRRLARKGRITKTGKIRRHCLRKFGITLMHGKIQEPVMNFMVGKHIDESLRTYIQNNDETRKAFKMLEPLISLTKSNGNGNGSRKLIELSEELKKERFERLALMELIKELIPEEMLQQGIKKLAQRHGLIVKEQPKPPTTKLEPIELKKASTQIAKKVDLEPFIAQLGKRKEEDLERILEEKVLVVVSVLFKDSL